MSERIRIAGVNAIGVVVDLFVIDDYLAFVESSLDTIEARWKGGIFALADHDPDRSVGVGWSRVKDTWTAPVTPLADKIEAINAATAAKIASGFDFGGQRFSLSEASQITISNAYTIRASLPYPLDWANIDDTGFVTMKSATDIASFYQAATSAVLAARTAGNAVKKAVIG